MIVRLRLSVKLCCFHWFCTVYDVWPGMCAICWMQKSLLCFSHATDSNYHQHSELLTPHALNTYDEKNLEESVNTCWYIRESRVPLRCISSFDYHLCNVRDCMYSTEPFGWSKRCNWLHVIVIIIKSKYRPSLVFVLVSALVRHVWLYCHILSVTSCRSQKTAVLHIFHTTDRTSCPNSKTLMGHVSWLSVLKQQKW